METENNSENNIKKKYCNRNFRNQLAKALNANYGEPENFEKIKSNKLLSQYEESKIKEFTNNVAEGIQKHVEHSIKDPRAKEIFTLANVLNDISGNDKPQELPLLLKLNASTSNQGSTQPNQVNFSALNKFLYSAVSGLPDTVEMNDVTKSILIETYENLMRQVDSDAPEVLNQLKSNSSDLNELNYANINNLVDLMHDGSLNPFNVPNECLFKNKTSD